MRWYFRVQTEGVFKNLIDVRIVIYGDILGSILKIGYKQCIENHVRTEGVF